MLVHLSRNWWVLVVQGVLAVLFGLMAWIWPAATVFVLVVLFGAYVLVEGVVSLIAAVRGDVTEKGGRGWMAFIGVVSVVVGLIALFWPGITALALLYVIAAWAIVRGAVMIAGAVRLRREIEGEWVLIVTGALSVLAGILLMVWPGSGVLAVIWLVGVYAVLFGVLEIAFGLRVRNRGGRIAPGEAVIL